MIYNYYKSILIELHKIYIQRYSINIVLIISQMNNPFIDTMLYTTIILHPSQLDNKIYTNIKQNLIKTLEKKCYKNYGYISKVYEILERSMGIIVPEDNTASVTYKIKFSCRLCHPLENTQIICRVNQTTDVFVSLIREPIHIIATADGDRINGNIFYKDQGDKKIKIKKTNEILEPGTFVKVTILSKKFIDKDRKIIAIGSLDDIATDDELQQYYTDEYARDKHFVDYSEYTTMTNINTRNETLSNKKK